MKKIAISLSSLAVVAFITLVSITMATPPQAEAGTCAGPQRQTAILDADGYTCNVAKSILYSQLEEAACDNLCDANMVITMECMPNGGGYWVSGYLTYRCELCPDIRP